MKPSQISQSGRDELRSRKHQISIQSLSENRNSRNSETDEDSEEELKVPTSPDISDSQSSEDDDDDDDSEDEIPPVIFNHPLVNDLLDRFMRAQLQNDVNANNVNIDKNNVATGKKGTLKPAPIHAVDLKFDELRQLCYLAMNSFAKQKSLLRIGNEMLPITICADVHGQFRDVRCILSTCGNPLSQTYLFLGDYVDRGSQGIETVTMLMCFKIKYPTRVYMLRGNHEDANTTLIYGFYDECITRFPNDEGELLWHVFMMVFNMMPLTAIIGDRILCMHGGLSPHLNNIAMLEKLPRPSIVPPYGIMCDVLWSDPDDRYPGWALSARGISFTFSSKVVKEFCETNNIDLIVRGHQLTADMFRGGYKYFADGRLITIFSAPNYLNMKNDSCVLHISRKFKCRFTIFRPIFIGPVESQNDKAEAPHAAPVDGY
ncbi:Serine/threonine-protein phosphatase PP1 isozyme [Dirofilaria immitis]